MYLEWSFFEVNTIIVASLHSDVDLAAHTTMTNLLLFFYMMP
jgi:Na+-driven multidrug efflux pump